MYEKINQSQSRTLGKNITNCNFFLNNMLHSSSFLPLPFFICNNAAT